MTQTLQKETAMDRLALDYIVCSYLWNGTTKDSLILMDYLYSIHPRTPVEGPQGDKIDVGVIEHWENEADGLKMIQDGLNEFYRQFPRTEEHAFRDETKNSIFNLQKIYEQIDYNDGSLTSGAVTKGNFQWENGIKDSRVIFTPDPKGRFNISWVPSIISKPCNTKNGRKHPGNEHMGAFGCDRMIYQVQQMVEDLKEHYTA